MSKKSNISLKEVGFKLKTINTDPKTGSIESEVVYLPDFAQVFEDLQNAKYGLYDIITNNKMDDILKAKISKDTKLNQLYQDLHNIFNKYRTHIRTQYPSEYEAMKHSNVSENFEVGEGEQHTGKKFIAKKNMKLHELRKLIKEELDKGTEEKATKLAQLLNKYQPKIAGLDGRYFMVAPGFGLASGDLVKKFPGFGDSIDITNLIFYSIQSPEAHEIVNKLTNGKYIIQKDESYNPNRPWENYYFKKVK